MLPPNTKKLPVHHEQSIDSNHAQLYEHTLTLVSTKRMLNMNRTKQRKCNKNKNLQQIAERQVLYVDRRVKILQRVMTDIRRGVS